MRTHCKNPSLLIEFIQKNYPEAKMSHPTEPQTQFAFPCKLIINVYSNGTVYSQGKDVDNPIVDAIFNVANAIT